MKKAFAFVISLSFLILVLSSCNNSVDDMLDDYNGGFKKGYVTINDKDESEKNLEPGDQGFDQKTLLYPEYTVFDIATLNLNAPKSCKSFSWILTDPKAENVTKPIKVKFYDGTVTSERKTRDFIVYMPESGLEIGHTYYLTLTVTGKDGRVYSDLAQIFTVEFHIEVDS